MTAALNSSLAEFIASKLLFHDVKSEVECDWASLTHCEAYAPVSAIIAFQAPSRSDAGAFGTFFAWFASASNLPQELLSAAKYGALDATL